MYHGEVNIAQEDLSSFLAVAQDLKVKGLTQPPASSSPTLGHNTHRRSHSSANNNPESPHNKTNNKMTELKHELLESDDDNANDEKENSYHENESSSDLDNINTCKVRGFFIVYFQIYIIIAKFYQALQKYDNGESQLNLSGDLGLDIDSGMGAGEADTMLSQHISRQSGGDRTDYVCLICQKVCKSRDECANHIEVRGSG